MPSRWTRCCQEPPLARGTGTPSSSRLGSEKALLCLFGPSPAQCPVPFILTEYMAERVYLCLLGFVRNQCCVHTGEGQDQTGRTRSRPWGRGGRGLSGRGTGSRQVWRTDSKLATTSRVWAFIPSMAGVKGFHHLLTVLKELFGGCPEKPWQGPCGVWHAAPLRY